MNLNEGITTDCTDDTDEEWRRSAPVSRLASSLPNPSVKSVKSVVKSVSNLVAASQRCLLGVWISLFLAAVQCFATPPAPADKNFSREAMLRSLAQKVIVPGYASLAGNCRALGDDIEQCNAAPTQDVLDRARGHWKAAIEAADSLRCYQTGPVADRQLVSTFYYWQTIPSRIESIVKKPSPAFDQAFLDNEGATVKGLYAIEYLLFDRRGGQPGEPLEAAKALDLLSTSPRRCEYLAALARDVADKATQLSKDWSATGPQGAAEKFSSGGQASLNLLVNQLTQSLETVLQNHLNFALALPTPVDRQLNRIKGSRSGTSLQGVIVALEGVNKFYRGENGLGLHDSLNRVNPAVATRVQDKLTAAIAAARGIGEPLERAVVDKRGPLETAVKETHDLEVLFKVDLPSALGVTITFTSGDGD
jgi:predicted lipoprotein